VQELRRRQIGLNAQQRFYFIGHHQHRLHIAMVGIGIERAPDEFNIPAPELDYLREHGYISIFGSDEHFVGGDLFRVDELDHGSAGHNIAQALASTVGGNDNDRQRTGKHIKIDQAEYPAKHVVADGGLCAIEPYHLDIHHAFAGTLTVHKNFEHQVVEEPGRHQENDPRPDDVNSHVNKGGNHGYDVCHEDDPVKQVRYDPVAYTCNRILNGNILGCLYTYSLHLLKNSITFPQLTINLTNFGNMKLNLLACVSLFFIATGCITTAEKKKDYASLPEEQLQRIADSLAQVYIITDGHVDLPYRLKVKHFRLEREYLGIPVSTREGDFDYERAKKGGLDAPFMSIYIPSRYQKQPDHGKVLADSLINMIEGIAQAHPDKFALARTPAEIEDNTRAGKISLPMGMENGAPVGDDLGNVKYFYDRGIRYITLTHGKDNQICDSSYDTTATWGGLSPFGEKVVAEMNRVGIMVDISHVSDSTFYDVMKLTKAPAIASHSSCRFYTPGFQRNMSDDMIRALAANGGVIQINFGASFLDSVARANDSLLDSLTKILEEKKLTSADPEAEPIIAQFGKQHKELFSDVERVADHIDHVVQIAGIDHVGIGSDYDGVGDSLPYGLKDVSAYPNLIAVLLKRGYSPEDIAKICYKNVFRVWNKVIEVSEQLQ
jgi:membrane dipeptidase